MFVDRYAPKTQFESIWPVLFHLEFFVVFLGNWPQTILSPIDLHYAIRKLKLQFAESQLVDLQVTVLVEDENDNPPVLSRSSYEGHVAENSPPGTLVSFWPHPITATDTDENANADFSYSLQGNHSELFTLDSHSGILTVNKPLDREHQDKYKLRVLVKDRGKSPKTSQELLIISKSVSIFINNEFYLFPCSIQPQ